MEMMLKRTVVPYTVNLGPDLLGSQITSNKLHVQLVGLLQVLYYE